MPQYTTPPEPTGHLVVDITPLVRTVNSYVPCEDDELRLRMQRFIAQKRNKTPGNLTSWLTSVIKLRYGYR